MAREVAGKWGYSLNEENYLGMFDTEQEAKAEAVKEAIAEALDTEEEIIICQYRKASDPEVFVDADLLLEHSGCQDDYSGDWGDCWPGETKEQNQELTDAVQKVYAEWLDKHDLRPKWGIVDNETIQKIRLGSLLVPESKAQ